jgi:hypothetical protein
MNATCDPPGLPHLQSPLVLFARLELAVERGDHATAAEAQRALARIGIEVKYGRPRLETAHAD